MDAAPKSIKFYRIVALAICVAVFVLLLVKNHAFYHDDAFITLRYAHNFVHGAGIVWNPGERVQGYSNFLHLMLVSLLGFLGIDLWLASRIVCAAALLALAAYTFFGPLRLEGRDRSHPLDMIPFLLVSASAPIVIWMLGGLEGVLFSALVAFGVTTFLYATASGTKLVPLAASGTWLSLASLARPDGAIFLLVSSIFVAALARGRRLRAMGALLLPCALVLIPYAIWTKAYYGDFLSNTFYAKAEGFSLLRLNAGLLYVAKFALSPPYLLIWLLAAICYAVYSRRFDRAILYIVTCVIGYLIFIVYVGGDHMVGFRLLLPLVPLSGYALQLLLRKVIAPEARLRALAVYVLILGLSLAQLASRQLNPAAEDPAAGVGTVVGRYITKNWPRNSLIALNTAGSTPYYATENRYVDMLGINDRHIARRRIDKPLVSGRYLAGHAKGDGEYVLSRNPDFIIIGPAQGAHIDHARFLSDREIRDDPRFKIDYAMRQVVLDRNGNPNPEITSGLIFRYYERIGQ